MIVLYIYAAAVVAFVAAIVVIGGFQFTLEVMSSHRRRERLAAEVEDYLRSRRA